MTTTTELLRANRPRIQSIDILRGIIMIIMALDHTRDFFHESAMKLDPLDLTTTSPALFFTRWITHFCAPIFVFLSGVSAFISGQRKTKKELSAFLIKRGIWLVLVELAIVTLGITFDPTYNLFVLQVIWAIGLSMILLGLMLYTSTGAIAIVGAILVAGHNIFNYIQHDSTLLTVVMTSPGTFIPNAFAGRSILDAYAVLPWTGIMFLGYAFGTYYRSQPDAVKRRKTFLKIGSAALITFVVIRFINEYGDPSHWSSQKNAFYTFLSFINVSKYPPSLLYTLMIVGIAILLLAALEKINNPLTRFATVYGKVPFFYYILHFYLIHVLCVFFFFFVKHYDVSIAFKDTPFGFRPPDFGYGLPVVYAVWIAVVLALYYPCRWFARYKQTHTQWWLSYL